MLIWSSNIINLKGRMTWTKKSRDKHGSGNCLLDQSGPTYIFYCPRLVCEMLSRLALEVLARQVWDLIFSLLPQISYLLYFVIRMTSHGPHIFTAAPDLSGKYQPTSFNAALSAMPLVCNPPLSVISKRATHGLQKGQRIWLLQKLFSKISFWFEHPFYEKR